MPRTLVCFHAHPDDEAIATGGTIADAAARGHRVVLVFATRGEHGEVAEGFLEPEEQLWQRRVAETHAAAEILGAHRVVFLGYVDSGMMGEPTNEAPGAFWSADVDEAAARLAEVLREESADVLTIYDERGNYGHPDHIQVHRVGARAAELAGTPHVFEATMNRDHIVRVIREGRAQGEVPPDTPDPDEIDLGVAEAVLTTAVDVAAFVDRKRAAVAAHASQVDDEHFFLTMSDDAFRASFGWEWFIHHGVEPGLREHSLWDWDT